MWEYVVEYASFDGYSQTGKFDILIVSVINWIMRTIIMMGVNYNVPVRLRKPIYILLDYCNPLIFAVNFTPK